MSKRALISVTDKTGVVDFARELNNLGYEVISTGNTYKTLKENGVNAITIDEVTKFPEMLDGRVKTLNPYIHGGILYKRDNKSHVDTVNEYNIGSIDIVVVNLYDFEGTLKSGKSHDIVIENIDIGGPSMIRSAAKNYKDVTVVVDINDLHGCLEVMREFKDSEDVVAVAIKHTNPCGVGLGKDSFEAYTKCYESDTISIFGGIVGLTSTVDEDLSLIHI